MSSKNIREALEHLKSFTPEKLNFYVQKQNHVFLIALAVTGLLAAVKYLNQEPAQPLRRRPLQR